MERLLVTIRDRLQKRQYLSESAVREAIVLPVLSELGWDIFDPEKVLRECTLGARRVDYALSATPPRRDIFIEVKAVGSASGADRQLFEYAFHEGIPFAVLTDGQEWSFFLPGEQGNYDERRVQKVDVVEREPSEAAHLFLRYLSFARVSAGEALEAAKADYRSVSRRKIAARRLSDAWEALVSEPDDLLLELLTEKTESLCGYRPDAEDVEDFLLQQLERQGTAQAVLTKERAVPIPANVQPLPIVSDARLPVSERKVRFELLGQRYEARSAIDALVKILKALSGRNPELLPKLAQIVPTKTRNHIARSPDAVYPNTPKLAGLTTELEPGWWLGTNIANREKLRIIKKACEVQGLAFGRDVKIDLPNAQ